MFIKIRLFQFIKIFYSIYCNILFNLVQHFTQFCAIFHSIYCNILIENWMLKLRKIEWNYWDIWMYQCTNWIKHCKNWIRYCAKLNKKLHNCIHFSLYFSLIFFLLMIIKVRRYDDLSIKLSLQICPIGHNEIYFFILRLKFVY